MLNVAIIGAGEGGSAILKTLLTVPDINIYCICDNNNNAPGVKLAKRNNITVCEDYMSLLDNNFEKIIIEVTGNQKIQEELKRNAGHDTTIVDSNIALLLFKLVNSRETVISKLEKESADLANLANEISSSIQETSAVSIENSKKFNKTIDDLVMASNKNQSYISETSTIIGFINNVSKQTKMLGLNAAIEANRAGFKGNGFQVVADEIRNLAEETASSVQQITQFIDELNNSTDQTITNIENMKEHTANFLDIQENVSSTLQNITNQINDLASNLQDIST